MKTHDYSHATHQEPCRILLVEDDFDDRMLGMKALESLENVREVLCFSNGRELVDYMRMQNSDRPALVPTPTLIIMDLNMPKMDGFEILRQLKPEPCFHAIPFIVVSSELSYENVSKAHALKASAFFRKPLSACDLQNFLHHGRLWPSERRQ